MREIKRISILLAVPCSLLAQAWLPPKGDGVTTFFYQYDIERLHTFSDGRTLDKGHTYLDAIYADTDLSLTDRLAVRVSLPFIEGKYVGPSPHLLVRGDKSTEVSLDNGQLHGGFQDVRFNVRYAATQGALKVVPFAQVSLPSNNYPTLGHAAVGVRETEYRFGVNVGRRLDPILPRV